MQSRDTAGSIKKEIKSLVEILTKGRCDSMFVVFVSKSGCLHGISLGTISVIVSMDDAGCTESMARLLNGDVLAEKAENSLVWRILSHLVEHAKLFIYSEAFQNKARLAWTRCWNSSRPLVENFGTEYLQELNIDEWGVDLGLRGALEVWGFVSCMLQLGEALCSRNFSINKKSSAIRARLLGWPHLKL